MTTGLLNSGVYEGSFDGAQAARDSEIAAWTTQRGGRTVAKILDFQAAAATTKWTDIEGPTSLLTSLAASAYKGTNGANIDLTVNMLPSKDAGGVDDFSTTLAQGAAGAYNSHFLTLANNLISRGLSAATLRIGHEGNGTWYRWAFRSSAYTGTGTAPGNYNGGNPNWNNAARLYGAYDYRDYFQQIVTTMRGAAGAAFKFEYCPNLGISGSNSDWQLAYPGDAYVDYIGMDFYDQSWASGSYPYVGGETAAQRAARQLAAWNDILNGSRGLVAHKNFAVAHGKLMSYPEWGLFTRPDGHGGMDDPDFIDRVDGWFSGLGSLLAHEMYFDFVASDGDHYIGPGTTAFPLGRARYIADFSPAAFVPAAKTIMPIPNASHPRRKRNINFHN